MDSRGEYQVLVNSSEETGGDGAGAGMQLVIDANQGLSLTLYSRLIYFILKQGRLAQVGASRLDDQVKHELKETANKAIQNDGIDRSVRVLKGNSGMSDELKKQDGVEGLVIGSGGTFMDFWITMFRSFGQVLADVLQRNDNVSDGSQDNADSVYSHTMFNDGHPESGLTTVGQVSLASGLVSPVVGLGRGIYQTQHKKTLKSHAYFAKQASLNEAELEDQLHARLKKAAKEKTLSVYHSSKAQSVAEESSQFVRVATKAYRVVSSAVSFLWDRLSTFSYIFWLAWMPIVMAFGLAAASGPMLPVVLIITFSVGGVLTALKLFHIEPFKALFSKNEAEQKQDVSGEVNAEFERLAHATKLLTYIDQESLGIAADISVKFDKAKPRSTYHNDLVNAELRDRLLGSVHERRGRVVVAGFRRFLGGLLTLVFIGWLSSAVLGYFGLTAAADFIGGVPFGGIGGAIAGIFTSISAMLQLRQQQLAYEAKVNAVLQEPYRGDATETKEQAFQRLYAQVEKRKQLVEKYLADHAHEIVRPEHFDELGEASQQLFKDTVAKHAALRAYLAKIDVFNDRYFEKFEHNAGAFTVVKKIFNRVYEFLGASQTGAFTARFTLLKGGLLAGGLGFTLLAGMWPFLIAAAVLMVVLGTVALIDYQMRVNQEHRENFLNTLDARLYYLETKNNELFAVQRANDIYYKDASELEVAEEPVVASAPVNDRAVAPSVSVVGSPDVPLVSEKASDAPALFGRGPDMFLESGKELAASSLSGAVSGLHRVGFYAPSKASAKAAICGLDTPSVPELSKPSITVAG